MGTRKLRRGALVVAAVAGWTTPARSAPTAPSISCTSDEVLYGKYRCSAGSSHADLYQVTNPI
jgi:hypothetical protein